MKENPAELMMNARVGQMISELRKEFDFILIDSSPVGQVADTFSLVPYVDSSIYVIRYNYTSKSQVNVLNDIASKLKDPMIVMNDAKGGNFNGYGYGYGYNPTDNKKAKLIG